MDNAGVYDLAVTAVTAPLTSQVYTPITGLDGISAACLECELLGGTGGTSIDVLAQTSFDGGTTWLDVAHFTFTTAPAKKFAVINSLASKGVTAYSALSAQADAVNDGLLGDQLRAVISSTGTYTNTTVALRAHAK